MSVPKERPPADEAPEYQNFQDGNRHDDAIPAAAVDGIDPNSLLVTALTALAAETNPIALTCNANNNPPVPPGIYPQAADVLVSYLAALTNNNENPPVPAIYPHAYAGALIVPVAAAVPAAAESAPPSTTVAALSLLLSNHSNNNALTDATAARELLQSFFRSAPPPRNLAHEGDMRDLQALRELSSILVALQQQRAVGASPDDTRRAEEEQEQGSAAEPPKKKPAR